MLLLVVGLGAADLEAVALGAILLLAAIQHQGVIHRQAESQRGRFIDPFRHTDLFRAIWRQGNITISIRRLLIGTHTYFITSSSAAITMRHPKYHWLRRSKMIKIATITL